VLLQNSHHDHAWMSNIRRNGFYHEKNEHMAFKVMLIMMY
jgi:hypothetical protein